MKTLKYSMVILSLLSACSSGPSHSQQSCAQLGFTPGTDAYAQCMENNDIHERVVERSLFNPAKNMPAGMLVQQYTKGLSPLVNCTTYAKPIPGSPTLCD